MLSRHNHRKPKSRIANTARLAVGDARKAHWRSKPEWACKEVIYFASHGRSCREIEARFNRMHGDHTTVGHSWVAEYIKAHATEITERHKAMRRRPPRFFAVGQTWALDLSFMVNAQGFTFAMLGIIDHGSRRLLCLQQLPRKCTLTLLGHLLLTMARCDVPAVIRTDNEPMFASALWRVVLKALGICHRRSRRAARGRTGGLKGCSAPWSLC